MRSTDIRDPILASFMLCLQRRWRSVATLASGLIIMAIMIASGWFDQQDGAGIEWSHVAVYLCGVVVVSMQMDRFLRR